jgi:hypothetical protein
MGDNKSFHEPVDLGGFDIAISQVGQNITFDFRQDPVLIDYRHGTQKKPHDFGASPSVAAGAKVVIRDERNPKSPEEVVTYTVGSGLILSEADQVVELVMNGVSFTDKIGRPLKAYCSFINVGDIEYTFSLTPVDSPL